jgi:hypothetical protein
MLQKIVRLALGDHQQDLPKVVAIVELRESAALDAAKEAVEGAEGDILLIGGAPWHRPQFAARQADEAMEVAFPQFLGGLSISHAELINPERHGRRFGHVDLPPPLF